MPLDNNMREQLKEGLKNTLKSAGNTNVDECCSCDESMENIANAIGDPVADAIEQGAGTLLSSVTTDNETIFGKGTSAEPLYIIKIPIADIYNLN